MKNLFDSISIAKTYRPEIDGLRAIALILVLLFHAKIPGFSGGFIGVDVFFVISGYLITSHLIKEALDSGDISLIHFYARRVRRLFPALFLVLMSTSLAWMIFFSKLPNETTLFFSSVRWSVFGLGNFFFMNNTGSYFDLSTEEMPLLHLWSLGVEEQFYFIWPFIIVLIAKKWHSPSDLKNRLFLSLVSILMGSFICAELLHYFNKSEISFYMVPARAWELAIGGLIPFLSPVFKSILPDNQRFRIFIINFIFALALAGLFLCCLYYSNNTRFPGLASVPPLIFAVFVIMTGEIKPGIWWLKTLQHPILVFVGLISYGWYLWHWPFLAMLKIYFLGEAPPIIFRIGCLLVSGLFAVGSYYLLEVPLQKKFSQGSIKNSSSLLLGWALAGLIAVMTIAATSIASLHQEPYKKFIAYTKELSKASICDGFYEAVEKDTNDCTYDYTPKNELPKARIVMWGNSHAKSLFPMIEAYGEKNQLIVSLRTMWGTPGILFNQDYFSWDQSNTNEHLKFHQLAFDSIKSMVEKNPEIPTSVILASRWLNSSGEKTISVADSEGYLDRSSTIEGSHKVLEDSLKHTLKSLKSIGVHRILILLPYPEYKYDVLRCHMTNKDSCSTPRQNFESYRRPIVEILHRASFEFSDVKLIDATPYICNDLDCPQVIESKDDLVPVVRDDDHPSTIMGKNLSVYFKDDLDWLVDFK